MDTQEIRADLEQIVREADALIAAAAAEQDDEIDNEADDANEQRGRPRGGPRRGGCRAPHRGARRARAARLRHLRHLHRLQRADRRGPARVPPGGRSLPELPGGVRSALSRTRLVETSLGPARVHLAGSGKRLLALGHGAGGGVDAWDLLAARAAALDLGLAGRAGRAAVAAAWRQGRGRAAPARPGLARRPAVAARQDAGGRRSQCRRPRRLPHRDRARRRRRRVPGLPAAPTGPAGARAGCHELLLPTVPVLVVQGERDAFGVPAGAVVIPGANHGFRSPHGLRPGGPADQRRRRRLPSDADVDPGRDRALDLHGDALDVERPAARRCR